MNTSKKIVIIVYFHNCCTRNSDHLTLPINVAYAHKKECCHKLQYYFILLEKSKGEKGRIKKLLMVVVATEINCLVVGPFYNLVQTFLCLYSSINFFGCTNCFVSGKAAKVGEPSPKLFTIF